MIKVLLVESSPVQKKILKELLECDPRFQVCGIAGNGAEALELTVKLKPDVIAIDTNLPGMDGLAVTQKIMGSTPVPIVLLSSTYNPDDQTKSFMALEAGAVALIAKPGPENALGRAREIDLFRQTLALMSEVKVVRRLSRRSFHEYMPANNEQKKGQVKLVAIGASTGGPQVIEKILNSLQPGFSIPILIVQHITSGFIEGFSSWLNMSAKITVKLAEDNERLLPATCYIAPDDHHLEVLNESTICLSTAAPEHSARPSISVLLRSIAYRCAQNSVGIVLTGMGKDGSAELGLMRRNGSITIAQDGESSLIFGIPGEAVRLNSAQYIFNPEQIIDYLNNLHSVQMREK